MKKEQSTAAPKSRGQLASIWLRLKNNKLAMILIAVFAGFIADYDTMVIDQNQAIRLQGPSREHILGTDQFGRDVFARIIHGSRISLSMSVIAMTLAVAIGALIGSVAGT